MSMTFLSALPGISPFRGEIGCGCLSLITVPVGGRVIALTRSEPGLAAQTGGAQANNKQSGKRKRPC
ncbi:MULTISPECIES: hypothetical protein [Alphaproteobacteria]|uniref:Uncharacterized protein n=2 Tax=Alphaproteobacteria TaxID=28211 RepID=A0A512HJ93_9HYPH|nr:MULTISPECIES: hypothetical protein [Alphaproteobacteria]GEO85519.1 hypothetical protein RNA01_24510 [Ciceribacter naphthalenivorans]GLR21459.1 hypothetical protein GCM10007920_12450 [Ciceribacter naphthalenivorans]GLT04315.1 hypothetical protein GCM10007926_12450 [Sphingomonas psychrolutea]